MATLSLAMSCKYFKDIVEFTKKDKELEKQGTVKAEEEKAQNSDQFSGAFLKGCGSYKPYHSDMPVSVGSPSRDNYQPSRVKNDTPTSFSSSSSLI